MSWFKNIFAGLFEDRQRLTGSPVVRRVPQPDDEDGEKGGRVLAVVVTVKGKGDSYDPLFTEMPQVVQGGVVRVYTCNYEAIPVLAKHLASNKAARTADRDTIGICSELMANIAKVDPQSVVFNFECCGSCSDKGFPNSTDVHRFTRIAIDNGHMVMFSDFSLKGLIGSWDAKALGPCPFVKVGELGASFDLRFSVEHLKSDSCPSAQLTKVAELCNDGVAQVRAMGGTIMYSVKKNVNFRNAPYKFEALTVVTMADGRPVTGTVKLPTGQTGILGHATLTYPSGGVILTSCGHWLSLAHLDTSQANLREALTKQLGADQYAAWENEYETLSLSQRPAFLQKHASRCVQLSAPCRYTIW